MSHLLAYIWLSAVLGVAIRAIVKHTDRYFWRSVGYGLLIGVAIILTVVAVQVVTR